MATTVRQSRHSPASGSSMNRRAQSTGNRVVATTAAPHRRSFSAMR